jgi:hypothetical protein
MSPENRPSQRLAVVHLLQANGRTLQSLRARPIASGPTQCERNRSCNARGAVDDKGERYPSRHSLGQGYVLNVSSKI